MSNLAEKLPGLGRGIAGSERAYSTFLNRLRVDSFDAMAAGLSRDGKITEEEAKAIANYINVATGRGAAGAAKNAFVGLNTIFFSPRYVVSRFQLLAGQPLWGGSMRTRQMVAMEYARFLTGLLVVYMLDALMGDDDDESTFDPRSSDFGKIRVGNTRIDLMAGLSQSAVLLTRLATGQTKTASGTVRSIRGDDIKYGYDNAADVIGRFLRSKLNPVAGTSINLATGKNIVGEEVTTATVIRDISIPLAFRDIYGSMKEQGVPAAAALSILAIFGIGIQTYETNGRKRAARRRPQRTRTDKG
jgi:hypothetical protein